MRKQTREHLLREGPQRVTFDDVTKHSEDARRMYCHGKVPYPKIGIGQNYPAKIVPGQNYPGKNWPRRNFATKNCLNIKSVASRQLQMLMETTGKCWSTGRLASACPQQNNLCSVCILQRKPFPWSTSIPTWSNYAGSFNSGLLRSSAWWSPSNVELLYIRSRHSYLFVCDITDLIVWTILGQNWQHSFLVWFQTNM